MSRTPAGVVPGEADNLLHFVRELPNVVEAATHPEERLGRLRFFGLVGFSGAHYALSSISGPRRQPHRPPLAFFRARSAASVAPRCGLWTRAVLSLLTSSAASHPTPPFYANIC